MRTLMPYLGRICGAIALDQGDDALQETMIAMMRHLGSLRDPRALRGWARRIAVREAVRQAARPPEDSRPEGIEVLAAQDTAETAADVRDVLRTLRPEQRAVLVLQHYEGLSEQEIAEALAVPAGTVKSRLNRGRQAFRKRWTS